MHETLHECANELYQALPAEVLQKLRKCETKMTVPPGARLITKGVRPEHLIMVGKGSVEVSIPTDGRAISLAVAGQGKVCGLRSIVGRVLPEIDVTTLEQCEITLVPDAAFIAVLKQHPEMYFAIAKVLSGDLKTAQTLLREISSRRKRHCTPGV